jgi:hypothetical protein
VRRKGVWILAASEIIQLGLFRSSARPQIVPTLLCRWGLRACTIVDYIRLRPSASSSWLVLRSRLHAGVSVSIPGQIMAVICDRSLRHSPTAPLDIELPLDLGRLLLGGPKVLSVISVLDRSLSVGYVHRVIEFVVSAFVCARRSSISTRGRIATDVELILRVIPCVRKLVFTGTSLQSILDFYRSCPVQHELILRRCGRISWPHETTKLPVSSGIGSCFPAAGVRSGLVRLLALLTPEFDLLVLGISILVGANLSVLLRLGSSSISVGPRGIVTGRGEVLVDVRHVDSSHSAHSTGAVHEWDTPVISEIEGLAELLATGSRGCCAQTGCGCVLLLLIEGSDNLPSAPWGLMPLSHFLLDQVCHVLLVSGKILASLNLPTALPGVLLALELLLSLFRTTQLSRIRGIRCVICVGYQLLWHVLLVCLVLDGPSWV